MSPIARRMDPLPGTLAESAAYLADELWPMRAERLMIAIGTSPLR
jgi:hypothetical protein